MPGQSLAETLALLPENLRAEVLAGIPEPQCQAFLHDWEGFWARPSQITPGTPGAENARTDWVKWVILSGRGWGKTKTGGQTVKKWASEPLDGPIHLIAPTTADIRSVMLEGSSGLMSCYPAGGRPNYEPSLHRITWPNGNVGYTFSADEPERLRGPQCCRIWADEIAAWRFLQEAWDNAMFGFRVGSDLRAVVTTTPKPLPLIKELVLDPANVVTRGSTYENRANLAPAFFDSIVRKYEGTRLGRQELLAEILEDVPGALWTRAMIETGRITLDKAPLPFERVVIAIDPAVTASETSDETGIGAIGMRNGHLFILEDASIRGTPNEWARTALQLFLKWDADRIVAEVNNGGDLVEANLRAVHPGVPYRAVRASRGKLVRAEPVAALYEQGRVHHVGCFPELEDQMCEWTPLSDQKSPDRLDWLVWGAYDLVIAPQETYIVQTSAGPRISPY